MISTPNRRGITLMVVAMACYVLNDTLVKLTLQVFPAGQVLTMRGVVAGALLATVSWRHLGNSGTARTLRHPLVVLRCALEVTTATFSVLALSHASLAVVSAIMMTAPLLIVLTSMLWGWERARPRSILGVAMGLAGALLVLRPAPQSSGEGIALACLCAVSLAARDLVTRRLPPSMPSALVATLTSCCVCAAGPFFGWTTGETWVSPVRAETSALAAAAVCAAIGNYALVAACRGVDLSVVTPFRYSLIVWACFFGFLVWGDVPDVPNAVGITVIVIAGVFTLRAASRP